MHSSIFRAITSLVIVLSLSVTAFLQASPVAIAETWISVENNLPGSEDWNVPLEDYAPEEDLAGYSTTSSVLPGEDIVLRVHNRISSRQRVHAHRLGWYGGKGGRLVDTSPWTAAIVQPDAELVTHDARGALINKVDASAWVDTLSLSTRGWPVGVYLLVVEAEGGPKTVIPMVVRSTSAQDGTLLVTGNSTWQAYNRFGGYSSYYGTSPEGLSKDTRSRVVSLNRPLDRTSGVQHFMVMERGLIVEAERLGISLAYTEMMDSAPAPA